VTKPSLSAVIQTLGSVLLIAAVLFGAAGRTDIPIFWIYVGVIAAVSAASLVLIDDELVRERMRPGGRLPGLRLILIALLCLAHWAIAGLDHGRFHWSDNVPAAVQLGAMIVFAAGISIFIWAMHVNRFFSSVVRIQRERGHHVITGGPYRWVRHPGYAAVLPATVASGMALCSWLATAIGALGVPLLLWRTIAEDQMLRAELPGYQNYAREVRWRLLPGIW
jgi:protein-S-isoprenylcysteine O-methyltransferase Ste14